MSSIVHLVEASLYVDDLEKAIGFYRDVLCLESVGVEPGRHAFFKVGQGVLLIFVPAVTSQPGDIPSHGAIGPGHVALGILEGGDSGVAGGSKRSASRSRNRSNGRKDRPRSTSATLPGTPWN